MNRIMRLFISLFFIASMLTAQSWQFDKVFLDLNAPQSNGTGFHGVAVDPNGNIWMAVYGDLVTEVLIDGTDTTWTRPILVMDPNGNHLPFSPLYLLEYPNSTVDTLTDNPRGLNTDKDGNILYTAYNTIYRIDYTNGKGLNKFSPQNGASLTNAAQSAADGNIYTGYVVPGGKPIFMLDNDFTLLGNATDSIFYINRSVTVSDNGQDLYTGSTWSGFGVSHFNSSAPGLINFAPVDTLGNWYDYYDETLDSTYDVMLWASTVAIGPDGLLWAGNLRPDWSGPKGGAWYAYDVTTGDLKETVGVSLGDSTAGGMRSPRGIAWTADGTTMYTADFDYSVIQVWQKGAASTVPITFEVDMSVQVNKGNFDAATGTVTIAGTMNGWDAGATSMSDGDGDLVYSVTLDLTEGDAHEFKFVKNGDGWESVPNRMYTVPGSADTFLAYFDDDDGRELSTIAISFQCNMELEIAAARFNPATDTLSARGSFNGWSDVTMLSPSATNPNIYEGAAQYETFDGDVIYYKFAYTTPSGTNWETNPPESDNYEHTVNATDISNGFTVVPLRGYNNATLETVVNQESVIRFVVDMNGAKDANGVDFPSIDNVAIAGANPPLAWPGGGWPDDDPNVIFLFDDGTNGDDVAGDKIFSKEITFPIYSPLTIQYKYGANWGLSSNNGINDNEAGVGADHFLTLFPSFWYGDAVDVFGVMGEKDIVNGVEQLGSEIPARYELGQNYPNPFNPSTVINFSIPESGLVTLKVFNILGQEVVELVNDVKSAGTYEVSFDASGLTTGMYVYKIQSGNYTATKKMMLIK
ncbi:MAG: T9SS type A sorting domain-containing protein [Melioribacteraceae bacterium]|nr:T9SS type A sorting domain-containing protein [Melioribacteraceae bacterium]